MVRLIRKNNSGEIKKTVLWCAEIVDGKTVRRKQFTIYDVPLTEIQAILLKEFKIK